MQYHGAGNVLFSCHGRCEWADTSWSSSLLGSCMTSWLPEREYSGDILPVHGLRRPCPSRSPTRPARTAFDFGTRLRRPRVRSLPSLRCSRSSLACGRSGSSRAHRATKAHRRHSAASAPVRSPGRVLHSEEASHSSAGTVGACDAVTAACTPLASKAKFYFEGAMPRVHSGAEQVHANL